MANAKAVRQAPQGVWKGRNTVENIIMFTFIFS